MHLLKSGGVGGIVWGRVGDCKLSRDRAAPGLILAKSYKVKTSVISQWVYKLNLRAKL